MAATKKKQQETTTPQVEGRLLFLFIASILSIYFSDLLYLSSPDSHP